MSFRSLALLCYKISNITTVSRCVSEARRVSPTLTYLGVIVRRERTDMYCEISTGTGYSYLIIG